MTVLLSIKPQFAAAIFDGSKRFEYRKKIFKRPVTKIVVYASSPTRMVLGEFIVRDILFDDVGSLWHKTKQHSGISKKTFQTYFLNRNKGYAIRVGKTVRYKSPKPLRELYGSRPPQSFAYMPG